MRKMKRIFKVRERLLPLFNWGKVHFLLNTISLAILIISLCFTGITELASTWFIACMLQYFPIFAVFAGSYILQSILYKKVISIIKTKTDESKVSFVDIKLQVEDFSLYSCVLKVQSDISTIKQANEFLNIVHGMNRKFGNGYNVTCILDDKTVSE